MADQSAPQADHGGYEKSDANIKMVVISAAILAVVVAASFVIVRVTFLAMQKDIAENSAPVPAMLQTDVLPPSPRLRVNAAANLKQLHSYEHDLLNTYEWVDQELGLARIPIQRAKLIVLEQGQQSFPAPEALEDDEVSAAAATEAPVAH